jgi:diadenylate cyclase
MPLVAQVTFSWPRFTITSVIDIIAVAIVVYQLLMIVRGTRAGHILVGILMMVFIYVVSMWAGLGALHSLLSFIVPYTALAIIVLFQSEIRRTLARIGRKRLFGTGFRRPESTDEILMAAQRLAQDKIGALIVLERDIGLRTFIESGVRLEAFVSRDLLLSIFQPGTALHDGAVIVQKDRIAAAACFLPLSLNPQLSGQLGTRHRAAIGITEETDCLSIVVSEETGRISLAIHGELSMGLGVRELDARISAHFGARKPGVKPDEEPAGDIPTSEPSGSFEKVNRP